MKWHIAVILLITAVITSASPTLTGNLGCNIGHKRPDGNCKTTSDWVDDFRTIKSWSHGKVQINTVRLFSTYDCFNLKMAVPAAQATHMKIWVTIWATPESKYHNERNELDYAIRTWGTNWLAGINVGSEHLYQGKLTPETLVGYITEVKNLVHQTLGAPHIAVGCADTWTQLVQPSARIILETSDVILSNGFPYWQGIPIEDAGSVFATNFAAVRNIFPNKPIIVGEGGWPTSGPAFGSAVTSIENQQRFWSDSVCPLLAQGIPYFWFSAFDEPRKTGDNGDVEKHFGIATVDRVLKIRLEC